MVGGNSGTPTIRTFGRRSAGCGFTDAEERKGDMGGPIKCAFSVLQFCREISCVPMAIRERVSPTRNGSGHVRYRTGNPHTGIWRHGQAGRDAMIRDKFIAGQRHCGLRRQLDGFAPDTPIGEIVDSCRVWESHSDREPSSDDDQDRNSRRQSGNSRKLERKK